MMSGVAWARGLAGLAVVALLAGCATEEPGHRGPGERGGQQARAHTGPTLFISPAGQPFRARAGEPYPVAAWFAQVDRTGTGKIDRAEMRADAEAFFKTLDKNHDGVIDAFELSDYEQKIAPEILGAYGGGGNDQPRMAASQGGGGGGRGGGGRRGGGMGGGGAPNPSQQRSSDGVEQYQGAAAYSLTADPEPVASADAALDGKITLAAFLAAVDRRFDALDAKHQGYLTLADLPKTPAQRRMPAPKPAQPAPSPTK